MELGSRCAAFVFTSFGFHPTCESDKVLNVCVV